LDRRRAMIAVVMYTARRANTNMVLGCIIVVGDGELCAGSIGKCYGIVVRDSPPYL